VPHRRADSAGEHEAERGRGAGDQREPLLDLARDVSDVPDLPAQVLDRARELLALGLDLALYLLRCASVRRHQLFRAPVVSFASRIACSGTGGEPRLISRSPASVSAPASPRSRAVTRSSASQVAKNVSRAAASARNAKPSPMSTNRAAPATRPRPMPSAATLRLSSSCASSSSSRARVDACSATILAAPPRPPFVARSAWVGMAPPVDDLCGKVPRRKCAANHEQRVRAAFQPAGSPPV